MVYRLFGLTPLHTYAHYMSQKETATLSEYDYINAKKEKKY